MIVQSVLSHRDLSTVVEMTDSAAASQWQGPFREAATLIKTNILECDFSYPKLRLLYLVISFIEYNGGRSFFHRNYYQYCFTNT